jgi:hypothetical protein
MTDQYTHVKPEVLTACLSLSAAACSFILAIRASMSSSVDRTYTTQCEPFVVFGRNQSVVKI